MLQSASQVILVTDSSKYGSVQLGKIAPLSTSHQLVTDDSLPDKAIAEIEAAGVEVISPRRMAAQVVTH